MTISNCGHDERGKYSDGQAGDQTGTEWYLRPWYRGGWVVAYRHPDARVRALIAQLAEEAARNDNVGYDQNERLTFWTQLQRAGYYPSKITAKCEADCSSGVAAIVKAAGYLLGITALQNVNPSMYTGNQDAVLRAAGFELLTASKYLTGEAYLTAGDILRSSGHTVIEVSTGASAAETTGSASNVARRGSTGELVRRIQSALISKGYSCGSAGVDGSFGADTEAAVRRYQKDHGLEVDGIAGSNTQASLFGGSTSASAYSPGTYQTCVGNLRVRTGAGTSNRIKAKHELTADGQRHSNAAGELNSGTRVTVSQVQQVGSEWWGLIPSGWICLYQGKTFAVRV